MFTIIQHQQNMAGGELLGQQIEQGLVWRVFRPAPRTGKSKLLLESHDASPTVKLPPGDYTVNAAFGRANLTRKISIKASETAGESMQIESGKQAA